MARIYIPTVVPADVRERLIRAPITLNGEPAAIRFVNRDFPDIVQKGSGLGCQWSWPTIQHIIDNRGGGFRS